MIGAATESMRVMMNGAEKPRGFLTGRVTGAQTGAVLAYVSAAILGQYDPFATANGAKTGCLLLVYPNVIAVERQLRVEPSDFRLWVCLHEVTHRVQFTANPWLPGYMSQALGLLTRDTGEDMGQVIGRLAEYARNRGGRNPTPTARGFSVWCARCSPNRSDGRWTNCWCWAPCWRATPTTSWTPSGR